MTIQPSSCNPVRNHQKRFTVLLQAMAFVFTILLVEHSQLLKGGNCPMTKKIVSLTLSLLITSTACLMAVPQTTEAAPPRRGPAIHQTHHRPPAPPMMRRSPRPPRPPRHYHHHHHHSSRTDRAIAAAAIIAAILSAGR